MAAFYNEIDPFAAWWLRNLIDAGHIAGGVVDERSITEVSADDLRPFQQCHFFAGFGGWSRALRLSGWPDDRHVWTGSCPCQPFSAAGKRGGAVDARHLWPAFYRLIAERPPAIVFGEQVASKDGRHWLSAVRADLEHLGYAVGAADLPAAGVGAPHIRQRLFWVADGIGAGLEGRERGGERTNVQRQTVERGGAVGGMGDANGAGSHPRHQTAEATRCRGAAVATSWADLEWLPCRDGKARPTQPGLQPLAHGVSCRVGRLRAYGNAIVPQVAAAFIEAVMDCRP
jgi:DNA (cytosine-5)-methyltransferase 1